MNPLLWPRWAQGAVVLVIAIAAFLAWLHFHDRAVVKADRAKQNEQVAEKTLDAERTANELERYREAKRKREEAELRAIVGEAERNNPDETSKPSGPAVSGVLERLRSEGGKDSNPAT